jgi:multidrug efflux pump subunit AcrB
MEQLRAIGNQLRAELAQVPDVIHTRATLTEALPKLALQVDEAQAQRAGLDNRAIAHQLNRNLDGAVGGSILDGTKDHSGAGAGADATRAIWPSVLWKW